MNRRAFLPNSGRTVMLAVAAGAARSERSAALEQSQMPADGLDERVAAVIQTYDAQGNHRTGTEVDNASAQWLAETTPFRLMDPIGTEERDQVRSPSAVGHTPLQ